MNGAGGPEVSTARNRSWWRFVLAASAILTAGGLALLEWGERVPVAHGAGWDGKEYARIARDLPEDIEERRLDRYRVRRVLPSALAYGTLALLDRPATVGRIARVFGRWNVFFLVATCWVWAELARTMRIGAGGRWLGFVLLFGNFANLKMPFYYPVLTDSAALFLGAALVLFHLRDHVAGMAAILALAAFTWPALALTGASLFVLRRRPLEPTGPAGGRAWLAGAVALAYVSAVALLRADLPPMSVPRFLASVTVAATFLFVVTWSLVPPPAAWPALFADRACRRRLVLLLACGAALEALIVVGAPPTRFTHGFFLHRLLVLSLARPGLFLVAHPVYLGLVVPLLALSWPAVVRHARGLGAGVMLFLWAHLVWGLHPESRSAIDVLPLLVLLVTLAGGSRSESRSTLIVIAALGLVVSKVWLPLNHVIVYGQHVRLPLYAMHHGQLMTAEDYARQAAGVVAVSAVLLLVWRFRPGAAAPLASARPG